MLNLSVTPAVRNSRLEKCQACKFFKSTYGTCGTPVVGKYVELPENEATYYKEKIRLCGCIMKIKTKLKFASCPAGKWGPDFVDAQQIQRLRVYVESVINKPVLSWPEVEELYNQVNKITPKKYKASTCPTCVATFLDELTDHLGLKHVDLTRLAHTEGLTPEIKQLIKEAKNGNATSKAI